MWTLRSVSGSWQLQRFPTFLIREVALHRIRLDTCISNSFWQVFPFTEANIQIFFFGCSPVNIRWLPKPLGLDTLWLTIKPSYHLWPKLNLLTAFAPLRSVCCLWNYLWSLRYAHSPSHLSCKNMSLSTKRFTAWKYSRLIRATQNANWTILLIFG